MTEDQFLAYQILKFWRHKYDTHEIAKVMKRKESDVANRLARARDSGKEAA